MFFSSAASAESITVQTDRLNMRKEASASSKSVGIVEKDDTLSFLSEDGEWYQVKDGHKVGFVMKDYVSLNQQKLAEDVAANTEPVSLRGRTTARINMRELPITSSDIVKVVPNKTDVEIIGQCGVWYQVKYSGKTGYLTAEYLTVEDGSLQAPSQPSAPESPAPEASAKDEIYSTARSGKTTARVNLRKSPTTSSSVVEVVDKNDAVTILGENGSWYLISVNGEVGYLSMSYVKLTTAAPSQPSAPEASSKDTLYAASLKGKADERVNLREEASTSSDILKVIGKGSTLTVLGENGSFYKVSASGKTGYVSRDYVTLTESDSDVQSPVGNDRLTVYASPAEGKASERVNLREAASTSSDIEKVVPKNASVTVLGEQGSFYQVKYSGKTGFIAKNYVTLTEKAPAEQKPETSVPSTPSTPSVQDTIYSKAKEGMTTVKVNMRREPEGDVLYTLAADTTVLLIGERGNWYLISWMNTTGYVSKSYVTENVSVPSAPTQPETTPTVKPETSKGTTAYITGSVNMRKGAGTNFGIIKVLTRGEEITFYSLTDGWYYVKAGSDTGYVSSKYVTTTKIETPAPSEPSAPEAVGGKVRQADWWTSDIQKVFARGVIATVTDVDTGISWKVKRSGGTNHADVQPLTAADTAKMKQAYGGTWSWNRRAIWVTIDGVSYAASMNGMPHGTGSITTNNFDGHHCIHFLNSRTHTGNRWDTQHQSMVQKAYKAGQK